MQKNGSKTRMLAYTALVAAVYAVLTVGVAPVSYTHLTLPTIA